MFQFHPSTLLFDSLELQLQGYLDASRPSGLICRVQANASYITSQAPSEHRGRAAEESAIDIAYGIGKIWSIQEIKDIHPELQVQSFRKTETPTQRQIQLP